MKIKIVVGIDLVLLCLSAPLFAYDEPDNFAGVKFGEDVRTQLRQCLSPSELLDKYERSGDLSRINDELRARCYDPAIKHPSLGVAINNGGELKHMGEISRMVNKILYEQVNNKLERVQLDFSSGQATALLAVLKQRYGEPTSTRQEPWESQAGVKTMSTHAEWTGKNVSIVFDERKSKINEGRIEYTTSAYREWAAKQAEERLKKAAGGL